MNNVSNMNDKYKFKVSWSKDGSQEESRTTVVVFGNDINDAFVNAVNTFRKAVCFRGCHIVEITYIMGGV